MNDVDNCPFTSYYDISTLSSVQNYSILLCKSFKSVAHVPTCFISYYNIIDFLLLGLIVK